MPNVIELEGGAFRRCLGPDDGGLMNGVSALIKGSRDIPSVFYHVRTQGDICDPEAGTLISEFSLWNCER